MKKIITGFFLITCLGAPITQPAVFCEELAGKASENVSLDYKDAELSSVLRSLAYSYNLNLVTVRDIKGKVTMSLHDITVDEALESILSVNGYAFTRKGNLIYITSGPGLEGFDTNTVTIPLKYLAASDASTLLQKVISSKGDIRVNEATNSLVVTDFPSSVNKVREVIKDVDTAPVQVLIESRLVDITEKDLENFGMTYSVNYAPLKGGLFNRQTGFQEQLSGTQSMAGPSATLTGGQLKFTAITFKDLSVTATVDALIQDDKAHLLASPSITTLNGKEARIIIGERFPYREKTQTTTGTTETTKWVDIGTTLRVTPRVSPDGWITMLIHPEVSSLTQSLDVGPRISTREADATIRVRDGETIVIGGLIKRQDDRTKSKIPLLGDIPGLNWLFGKSKVDESSTELVVFITPHIMRSPDDVKPVEASIRSEATVSITGVGERTVVNQLWNSARDLERKEGIESRRKDSETRMAEALEDYRQIASQYPGNEKADDALYRAGKIAYDYFGDLELSRQIFASIYERYSDSPYAWKAKKRVAVIDKKLAAREKRAKKQ